MSVVYHSGKNAQFYAGTSTANVPLSLISCEVKTQSEIVKFRTSRTGNFTLKEQTFYDADVTAKIEWDFSANPFLGTNGALSMLQGGTVAARLYLNGTSGAYWDFPQAWVQSNPQTIEIEGKIQTTVNLTANGAFVEPAV
jgi:hypothetical protein